VYDWLIASDACAGGPSRGGFVGGRPDNDRAIRESLTQVSGQIGSAIENSSQNRVRQTEQEAAEAQRRMGQTLGEFDRGYRTAGSNATRGMSGGARGDDTTNSSADADDPAREGSAAWERDPRVRAQLDELRAASEARRERLRRATEAAEGGAARRPPRRRTQTTLHVEAADGTCEGRRGMRMDEGGFPFPRMFWWTGPRGYELYFEISESFQTTPPSQDGAPRPPIYTTRWFDEDYQRELIRLQARNAGQRTPALPDDHNDFKGLYFEGSIGMDPVGNVWRWWQRFAQPHIRRCFLCPPGFRPVRGALPQGHSGDTQASPGQSMCARFEYVDHPPPRPVSDEAAPAGSGAVTRGTNQPNAAPQGRSPRPSAGVAR
jgi:hypothetical protein